MAHTKHPNRIRQTRQDAVFDAIVTILVALAGLITAYPLLYVLSASVSDPTAVNSGQLWLLPKGFRLDGYTAVFKNQWIPIGFRNSVLYTVFGTLLNVLVTVMAGFALSRKDLYGRKVLNWYLAIPMWFGGGLIPTYLTIFKLGMVNTPYILLIMGLVSSYNVIICRTYINSLPYELQEAAKIDGASDFQVLWRVVVPISAPIVAVLCLYYAVGHWNDYFTAMIYVRNKSWQTLQVFLREVLLANQNINMEEGMQLEDMMLKVNLARTMKYSLIVISSIPLLIAYPFVQKFFVKGVMVGSIKG